MCGQLTEVSSVRVEHGEANKLLYNLWPASNNETNQITAPENGPCSLFRVLLCKDTLLSDGCSHDFLEVFSNEGLNHLCRTDRTSCSWTS